MKRTGFALALLVFGFLPYNSFAQQMYPNYSAYQTATGNSNTITVSVTVDGSTSGNLCGQYGCIPPPIHAPSVYNTLKNTTTGAVTGGWQTGQGVTWNSYLSQTNHQSVPLSTNVSFSVSSVTQIICSAVGSFFFFQFPTGIVGARISDYIHNGDTSNACVYDLFCPNGNTHASCPISPVDYFPQAPDTLASCTNYLWMDWLWFNGKCFEIGTGLLAGNATNCN